MTKLGFLLHNQNNSKNEFIRGKFKTKLFELTLLGGFDRTLFKIDSISVFEGSCDDDDDMSFIL